MKQIDEDFFKISNKAKARKAEDFLLTGEKILWRAMPKRKCYVIQNSNSQVPAFVGILWGLIDLSVFIFTLSAGIPFVAYFILVPFIALHMTPTWIWLSSVIKARKKVLFVEYMITTKRVISFGGNPKYINFSVALDEIMGLNYKQQLLDKMFHAADIYISSRNNKFVLSDVPNGLFIYEKLEEICRMNLDLKAMSKSKTLYENNYVCKHCGSYFDSSLLRCPSCGAPKQTN